ncbi:dTMP kinase [Candidatus Saccharibacteria bacterium oral taxon 488]|jgi:dTMP kinase|nr:dTMP kinase [Candidatus Saccharibacteria bacterium oral taxon 488]
MSCPGRYIVIEGNDGTGKSTQVAMLADYFRARGRVVCVVEEPGSDDPEKSTPVANELRRIVKNGDLVRSSEINLALFSAARRELWREKIQPALQRGEIVLSARNYVSTLAYQGYGDGLDAEEIIRMTKLFTDERYLQPDAMVVLTLSDAQRQQRIAGRGRIAQPDTFESREQSFQDRVNHAYEAIAAERNIPLLSAAGTPEEVHARILDSITRYL